MYKIVHLQYFAKSLVKSKHKIMRFKTKYKSFATILNIKNNRNNNKLTENRPLLFNRSHEKSTTNKMHFVWSGITVRTVKHMITESRFNEKDRRVKHTWNTL